MEEPPRTLVRVLDPAKGVPADVYPGLVVELEGLGLFTITLDPMTGVADVVRMTARECQRLALTTVVGCAKCRSGTAPPGHLGSYLCRSGSLRSGGWRSHCSCDTCF